MRRFVSLSGWKSSGEGAASQSAIVGNITCSDLISSGALLDYMCCR
jgi:hypothetical protein